MAVVRRGVVDLGDGVRVTDRQIAKMVGLDRYHRLYHHNPELYGPNANCPGGHLHPSEVELLFTQYTPEAIKLALCRNIGLAESSVIADQLRYNGPVNFSDAPYTTVKWVLWLIIIVVLIVLGVLALLT